VIFPYMHLMYFNHIHPPITLSCPLSTPPPLWDLNTGPCACWTGILPLEPHSSPFAWVIFWIGSQIYAISLDQNPLIYTSHIAGMTDMCHPSCIGGDVVSLTFCPGWPQTTISTFQVPEIIGMSHCAHFPSPL
jgi:hypothetical protein